VVMVIAVVVNTVMQANSQALKVLISSALR
jgi:hypothetical protein